MRTLFGRIAAFAVVAALCTVSIAVAAERPAAAEGDKPRGSQQEKMKSCNAEAKKKELKGDERRAFMSSCLKGQPA